MGAGTGAMVAKAGTSEPRPGRLGIASAAAGRAVVTAVMVANSVGGIWDDERHEWVAPLAGWDRASSLIPGANTAPGRPGLLITGSGQRQAMFDDLLFEFPGNGGNEPWMLVC